MVEPDSIIYIVALFVACVALGIFLIHYYNKSNDLLNDTMVKYVVLRDLEGHKQKIGRFKSFGAKDKYYSVIIANNLGEEEEWLIEVDRTFSLGPPTIDYGRDEYVILCDFYKSKFNDKVITPVLDLDILKLGLTGGIRAIREETNPLYNQIKVLTDQVHDRDKLIQEKTIENFKSQLDYIRKIGLANTDLLDQFKKEYILASILTNRKISQKRQDELKTVLAAIEQDLQNYDKKVEEASGPTEKSEEFQKKKPKIES